MGLEMKNGEHTFPPKHYYSEYKLIFLICVFDLLYAMGVIASSFDMIYSVPLPSYTIIIQWGNRCYYHSNIEATLAENVPPDSDCNMT